jgi:flagellar hook-basal body complex protein FliE
MESTPITPGGQLPSPRRGGRPDGGHEFKELLEDYLKEVNQLQQEADEAVLDLASGKLENLHEVVAAVNEADLSFRLMMEVRNKLLDAYKEIMRMQV